MSVPIPLRVDFDAARARGRRRESTRYIAGSRLHPLSRVKVDCAASTSPA
jgi:hypothetical protein